MGGDGRQMTGKKKTQREDEWVGGREGGREKRARRRREVGKDPLGS